MPAKTKIGVLALTHSSRKTDLSQCSRETLAKRYSSPDRFKNLEPFEQLPSSENFETYYGGVSFYMIYKDVNRNISFKNISHVKSYKKIQHVILLDEKSILVVYESYLELWKLHKPITSYIFFNRISYYLAKRYDHPLFSGLHTASLLSDKLVVLSASASDAILILDLESGELTNSIRMPKELYGENYELTEEMDLRKHFIHNELQTTHINSAYPNKNNIVISALIPGVVGCFNLATKKYVELTSGYIGCHGARVCNDGNIYFTDSTAGKLVFIGKNGQIIDEFEIKSKWLHDSMQIIDNIFAFSVADNNELRIVDIKSGKVLFKKKFLTSSLEFNKVEHDSKWFITNFPFFYGNSTQFLSMYRLAEVSS